MGGAGFPAVGPAWVLQWLSKGESVTAGWRRALVALVAVVTAGYGCPGHAADMMADGCLALAARAERLYAIPPHLLQAVALTESGHGQGRGAVLASWPWTLNVEGEGRFFATKTEAVAVLRQMLASGRQSVDVGCMQINWRSHPRAFADADQALDPAANVAYGARFLRSLYDESGDWGVAVARYHSRNQGLGAVYLSRVSLYHRQLTGGLVPRLVVPARAAHVPAFPDRRFAQVDPVHAYFHYHRASQAAPADSGAWLGRAVALDLLAVDGQVPPAQVVAAYAQAAAHGGGDPATRRLVELAAAVAPSERVAVLQQAFRLSGAAAIAVALADTYAELNQPEAARVYRDQARRIARLQAER